MAIEHHGHEHEFEPQFGLPERLPPGERILWQGSPAFWPLAVRAFHLRKVALYFGALIAWQAWEAWPGGLLQVAAALAWPLGLAALGLAALALLAWLSARTTVYTLTDKRLVMRIGIVLTLSFNLPLRLVESAQMRAAGGDSGDIVLSLRGQDRIAYLHLWPHARAWHLARTQPALRCVPAAAQVSALLTQAWSAQQSTDPSAITSTPSSASRSAHTAVSLQTHAS